MATIDQPTPSKPKPTTQDAPPLQPGGTVNSNPGGRDNAERVFERDVDETIERSEEPRR